MFAFSLDYFIMQVIFAIGASMVVLAALVHLPRWAIATIGVGMIAGHNLLDGIRAEDFGALAGYGISCTCRQCCIGGEGVRVFALYPLIPWVGVMAAGYALGPLFKAERATRVRWLVCSASP